MKRIVSIISIIFVTILSVNLFSIYTSKEKTLDQMGASTKIPSTKITSVTVIDKNTVKFKWNKIKNVNGYKIYKSSKKNGAYKCIKNIKKNISSYTYKKMTPNKNYYFKIKAYKKSNKKKFYSKFSAVTRVKINYQPTQEKETITKNVQITKITRNNNNKLEIHFSKVKNSNGYKIYRKLKRLENDEYKLVAMCGANETCFIDNSVIPVTSYCYKVQDYKIVNGKEQLGKMSDFCVGVTADSKDITEYESTSDTISNEILKLMNNHRRELGLNPLVMTNKLNEVAKVRAKEIVTLYSHTRPNNTSFMTTFLEKEVAFTLSGENLMKGSKSAQQFYNAWFNSPGHRENMEDPSYTRVGIATYVDENGKIYAAQNFAN